METNNCFSICDLFLIIKFGFIFQTTFGINFLFFARSSLSRSKKIQILTYRSSGYCNYKKCYKKLSRVKRLQTLNNNKCTQYIILICNELKLEYCSNQIFNIYAQNSSAIIRFKMVNNCYGRLKSNVNRHSVDNTLIIRAIFLHLLNPTGTAHNVYNCLLF